MMQPAPLRQRRFDFISLGLGVLGTLALVAEAKSDLAYYAGLGNHTPYTFVLFLAALAIAICCGIEMARRAAAHYRRGDRRFGSALVLFLLAAIAWSAIYGTRTSPEEAYFKGFRQWTSRHADIEAIRQWRAAKTDGTMGTYLDPSTWTAEMKAMRPTGVMLDAGGVLLHWGTHPQMRAIFISIDDEHPPRDTYHWSKVRKGLWAGFQVPG